MLDPEKKALIDALWANIDFWESEPDTTLRERLEGVVFATLCSIDGAGSPFLHFRLQSQGSMPGAETSIEDLHDDFYYKRHEARDENTD